MTTSEFKDDEIKLKLKKDLIRKRINISNLTLIQKKENCLIYDYGNIIIEIICMENCKHCSIKDYVKNSNYILQPLDETLIKIDSKSLRVLYLPKLYPTNITNDDVIDLYCKLRDDGYLCDDIKKEDFVCDENGNILLDNYDKLIYVGDLPMNVYQSYIEDHVKNNPYLNKIYIKKKKIEERNKLLSKIKFWVK